MGHWVPVGVQKLVILEYKHKTMQFKGSPCQTILDAEAIATIPPFHSSSFEINHLVAHDNKISEWLEGNCSDEQKSSKKYLVKFGARYVSFYVARAPAVNIVKVSP